MRQLRAYVCGWHLLLLAGAADSMPVPALRAPVTDLTRTLTAEQISSLDAKLRDLQARKGAQLAILMLPATAPETIEQYAIRVAEAWQLGRKEVDDGVLLLIAKDERAVRIEVGYGLEGVLNDATVNRIIRQLIVPQFRQGNYYQGIDDASVRIIQLIDGEVLPEPATRSEQRGVGDSVPWPLLIFGVVAAGSVLRGIFGRLGAAGLTAGGAGLLVWFFIGSILAAAVAAIFAFVFVLGSGGSGWGRGGRGGWSSGPGGGWGGGFGGGGGFRGGGGGFGGGGASGRW
jgi:uncharacterized protein